MTTYMFSGGFSGGAHPTLDWAVTPDQRARAEDYLQQAYAQGRITHDEFDRRIGITLQATTRRELNEAFDGLATIPTQFPGGVRPTGSLSAFQYQPLTVRRTGPTPVGALAQLSVLPTWLFGPGVVAVCTAKGTPAHREAAKAFNSTLSFTIIAGLLSMAAGAFPGAVHPMNAVIGLVSVLWVVFALVGAVKARNGERWTNPLSRVLPLKVLDER